MSLKKQAISGVKWTTISSIFNSIIQIVQLAILARILNPTDFGLMAIVMVVIGFSQIFIDMGLSNAIIYKQKITTEQLSSLYLLNILIGILFFVLLIISSPLIAKIYENQKLTPLINLVASTFLIKPWGQQFMVLLEKKLQFNAIAKTDIITRFISFVVVIVLAYNNFGVYALAIGSIVFALFSTIGYNYYGRSLYKPKLYLNVKQLKDFLSFGLFQMGEKIIQYFSSQFDTILIGKLLGIEVLGVYNVAKNLVSKPAAIINPVVTKVTFPLMSKFNDDISQLKSVFLKTISYLSFINIPVHLLIAVFAYRVILIFFGDQWFSAKLILQILAFAYLLRAIMSPAGSLLLSRGKANIAFYWNLATFFLYPISIIIGSNWGISGVALSTLILQILLFYPTWKIIIYKMINAEFWEYTRKLLPPMIISILSLLPSYIIYKINIESIFLFLFSIIIFCTTFFILMKKYNYSLIEDVKIMILNK